MYAYANSCSAYTLPNSGASPPGSDYAPACLWPFEASHHHQHPPPTTYHHLPPPTTTCHHLPSPTTTYHHYPRQTTHIVKRYSC